MRERGTYGPLDRDNHFAISWGADQVACYARDRTIGAALRPVLPVVDTVTRADRAINRLRMARHIGGRDEAQKSATVIGQEFFHSVADRVHALELLSNGFRALATDLATWHALNPDAPGTAASVQWLAADVTPTLEEWRGFTIRQRESWWTRAATSWETFEEWWDRLRQLRGLARAHGITLQSAEPMKLPKTIWQRGEEGKGTEATALIGILKVGVFTALTLTGAVSLFAMVRDLRPRKIT